MEWKKIFYKYRWFAGLLVILLLLAVFLPLPDGLVIVTSDKMEDTGWPRFRLNPQFPKGGENTELDVFDNYPWTDIIVTINGKAFYPYELSPPGTKELFRWKWRFIMPESGACDIVFFHDGKNGAKERGRFHIGNTAPEKKSELVQTKLGVFLANPDRDWHNRSGWNYLLTYSRMQEDKFWGVDSLCYQVYQSQRNGLRCIVRIDYDSEQALPPVDNNMLLAEYLDFIKRLAGDERLKNVFAYSIGSVFNEAGANKKYPDTPVTPQWYARVFNGYGRKVTFRDNIVQVVRNENSLVKVLVGPLRPWCNDADGDIKYKIDVPYLNYMNTLVHALNATAVEKQENGIPYANPDGFSIPASGRPEALNKERASLEPLMDIKLPGWKDAQAGFRIYSDWMELINSYPATRGLPLYILGTNTYCFDVKAAPAENYPEGWLKSALQAVNGVPQIHALCWFMDYYPYDDRWKYYSLSSREGQMLYAADDFDELLRMGI